MNKGDNAVSVLDEHHPVGSVSVLSFLTEASREEVYRDPIDALYGVEPAVTEQPLSETYTINSVDEDLLEVEKRKTKFHLAKSLDLTFGVLVGAAYVMATYSTLPDFDLRGGQHAAYSRKHPSIPLTRQHDKLAGPPQEVNAMFLFWKSVDPCFDLIRELKVSIPTAVAQELLDFDKIADAMATGALSTRADTVENITPKLSALEAIDAIANPDRIDDVLSMLCGPFGTQSELRGDVRLHFRDVNTIESSGDESSLDRDSDILQANLIPYELANPFLETLLSKLFSLTRDNCRNEHEQTWYLPGDATIYDFHWPVGDQWKESAIEAGIFSDIPDEGIQIPPSLILAGACRTQKALSFSYAELTTVAGLVAGASVWDSTSEMVDEIRVVYDTIGKLTRRRYCHFNEETDYALDEFVAKRLPVDAETATRLTTVVDVTESERTQDVESLRPGRAQGDLRVGAGYFSIELTEPAKLVCDDYLEFTCLDG